MRLRLQEKSPAPFGPGSLRSIYDSLAGVVARAVTTIGETFAQAAHGAAGREGLAALECVEDRVPRILLCPHAGEAAGIPEGRSALAVADGEQALGGGAEFVGDVVFADGSGRRH